MRCTRHGGNTFWLSTAAAASATTPAPPIARSVDCPHDGPIGSTASGPAASFLPHLSSALVAHAEQSIDVLDAQSGRRFNQRSSAAIRRDPRSFSRTSRCRARRWRAESIPGVGKVRMTSMWLEDRQPLSQLHPRDVRLPSHFADLSPPEAKLTTKTPKSPGDGAWMARKIGQPRCGFHDSDPIYRLDSWLFVSPHCCQPLPPAKQKGPPLRETPCPASRGGRI
jgi:hypothetical protein